jgi:hypothetical protein
MVGWCRSSRGGGMGSKLLVSQDQGERGDLTVCVDIAYR